MPDDMNLRIRAEREAVGITQDRLARMLGIAQHHVCNMESGKQSISFKRVLEIAQVLGLLRLLKHDVEP